MISNRDFSFIRRAAKEAKKSQENHKIGVVLVKGGKIVATTYNMKIQSEIFNPISYSKHAETRALTKRKYFEDIEGCICYVARIRKEQPFGLSKPCKECEKALRAAGISAVYYTTNDPNIPISYEAY
jgi:tRNA(Arg) A34 adenosine deaminase TadA